ncbi:MAG: carbohydrate-binding domain-containing protein [Lachnospiraceae bacterium]|nr:carbohydrate-binding domain-containing protein [Lachnospiraceae bacterium]
MRKGYLIKRPMKKQAILLSAAMLFSMAGCKKNDIADTTQALQTDTTTVADVTENGAQEDTTADPKKPNDETTASRSDTTKPAQEASGKELTTDYTGIDLPDKAAYTANNQLVDTSDKYMLTDESKVDAEIAFSGDSATASGENAGNVLISDENGTCVATITKGGKYRITGSSDNGRVYVDAGSDKVWLVLDGVDLTADYAPVYVAQADKTVLVLAKDSENKLADRSRSNALNEDVDAVVFSKDDLIINGSGSLTVKSNYDKGIHGKDDLRLRGGNITVDAVGDAIQGNDSIEISAGAYTITSKKDGFVTKTTDKDGKGYLEVSGGTFTINVEGDGFTAATDMEIEDGLFTITTGGGSKNGETHTDNDFGGWGRGQSTQKTDSTSSKGLKAETTLKISGGIFDIDSKDDAVHSDNKILISGTPYMEISTGDDGIHAEEELTLDEYCYINVRKSYEGYEAANITVNGGWHRIIASDDGLNAAGGSQTNAQQNTGRQNLQLSTSDSEERAAVKRPEGPGGFGTIGGGNQTLTISGGYLFVNAYGDGLDSNGKVSVSGGITVVSGPTSNMNGPLDAGEGSSVTVTGGILLAVGSTGMMAAPTANYVATTKLNAIADTLITITDEDDNVLVSFISPKSAQGLVASAAGKADGYKIYTGGTVSGTFNADNVCIDGKISGGKEIQASEVNSGGFGGFGGFGGGGWNGGNPFEGFEEREDQNRTPKNDTSDENNDSNDENNDRKPGKKGNSDRWET